MRAKSHNLDTPHHFNTDQISNELLKYPTHKYEMHTFELNCFQN